MLSKQAIINEFSRRYVNFGDNFEDYNFGVKWLKKTSFRSENKMKEVLKKKLMPYFNMGYGVPYMKVWGTLYEILGEKAGAAGWHPYHYDSYTIPYWQQHGDEIVCINGICYFQNTDTQKFRIEEYLDPCSK